MDDARGLGRPLLDGAASPPGSPSAAAAFATPPRHTSPRSAAWSAPAAAERSRSLGAIEDRGAAAAASPAGGVPWVMPRLRDGDLQTTRNSGGIRGPRDNSPHSSSARRGDAAYPNNLSRTGGPLNPDSIGISCRLRMVVLTAALGSFASGFSCASIAGSILFLEKDTSGFWPSANPSNGTSPSNTLQTAAAAAFADPPYSNADPSSRYDHHYYYYGAGQETATRYSSSSSSSSSSTAAECSADAAHPNTTAHVCPGDDVRHPTPAYFDDFKHGLLVSSILASGMVGALVASTVADLIGRRPAQLANNFFFIGGCVAMAFAPSYWLLVGARVATGIGVGVSSALTNLYISEISPAAHRGRLGGWAPFSVTAGILASYILSSALGAEFDPALAWRLILGAGAVPAVLMVALGLLHEGCLPESPRWLLEHGRPARAFRSALLLHGKEHEQSVQQELDAMLLSMTIKSEEREARREAARRASLERQQRSRTGGVGLGGDGGGGLGRAPPALSSRVPVTAVLENQGTALTVGLSSEEEGASRSRTPSQRVESELEAIGGEAAACCCCRLCSRSMYRRATLAGVGINVLQQVSGINVVIYFGPQILKNAGFCSVQATALTAGVSTAQLLAVGVLMKLVDTVGRRPMAFLGLAGMIVGLGTIAVAFFMLCSAASAGAGAWMAVGGMLIFRIAFSLSLGPLPYIVTAEVFPNEVRACGVTVSWAANWIANFGVTLSFPLVKAAFATLVGGSQQLGSVCLFGVYIVFSAFAVLFVCKFVPETARKTLDQL